MNEDNDLSKIYYPMCNERGCNGILIVKMNKNFTIDYECWKNL